MAGGSCGAELGKKIEMGPVDICGNPTIWFCDGCSSYFCDLHIGQLAGETALNSQDLCIKCKEKLDHE